MVAVAVVVVVVVISIAIVVAAAAAVAVAGVGVGELQSTHKYECYVWRSKNEAVVVGMSVSDCERGCGGQDGDRLVAFGLGVLHKTV